MPAVALPIRCRIVIRSLHDGLSYVRHPGMAQHCSTLRDEFLMMLQATVSKCKRSWHSQSGLPIRQASIRICFCTPAADLQLEQVIEGQQTICLFRGSACCIMRSAYPAAMLT